jgi:hypothetical protein
VQSTGSDTHRTDRLAVAYLLDLAVPVVLGLAGAQRICHSGRIGRTQPQRTGPAVPAPALNRLQ